MFSVLCEWHNTLLVTVKKNFEEVGSEKALSTIKQDNGEAIRKNNKSKRIKRSLHFSYNVSSSCTG